MTANSAATRASRGMASQLAATKIRIAAPNSNAAIIARIEPKLSNARSFAVTSRAKASAVAASIRPASRQRAISALAFVA